MQEPTASVLEGKNLGSTEPFLDLRASSSPSLSPNWGRGGRGEGRTSLAAWGTGLAGRGLRAGWELGRHPGIP